MIFNYWADLTNPYICYILGFIWADGHVPNNKRAVRFSIVSQDFKDIKFIFELKEGWKLSTSQRISKKWKLKEISIASTNSLRFKNFLVQNDYHIKSGASADKILAAIPENLQHYWWRGYFDGDGCFYCGRKQTECSISGPYHQDWDFAVKMAESLNLKYAIRFRNKRINSGATSSFQIRKRINMVNFGNYIYQGEQFGLKRKYEKFLKIKDRLNIRTK